MDLQTLLRSRRSVRRFQPNAVPAEALERVLTTATYAPSAHNRQPWRFAVVTTQPGKSRLADAMAAEFRQDLGSDGVAEPQITTLVERSRSRIRAAPVAIVLCMDTSEMDVYPDPRRAAAERTMALQSAANAGVMILLAAHAEGLAGVWNCGPLFAPQAVSTVLELPPTWEAQALFLLGKPAYVPKARPRRPFQDITQFR